MTMIKQYRVKVDATFGIIGSFHTKFVLDRFHESQFTLIILIYRVCTGLTEAAFYYLNHEVYAEWVCDTCTLSYSIVNYLYKVLSLRILLTDLYIRRPIKQEHSPRQIQAIVLPLLARSTRNMKIESLSNLFRNYLLKRLNTATILSSQRQVSTIFQFYGCKTTEVSHFQI